MTTLQLPCSRQADNPDTLPPLGRRRLLAGAALLPLMPGATAAAAALEPALVQALAVIGLAADKVAWTSPLLLIAPAVADDATAVPIALRLPGGLAVTQWHVFAPANRRVLVASVAMGGPLALPEIALRIRLARTQSVAAVAQLADGRMVGAQAEVRVTAGGGCST